jgi:hypothetical protein
LYCITTFRRLAYSQKLSIVRVGGDATKGEVSSRFVNVDTSTVEGLQRAKKLGLAQSGKLNAIYTPLIYEANDLFDEGHQGRLFAIFRHPIDRAISIFRYLQYVRDLTLAAAEAILLRFCDFALTSSHSPLLFSA